MSKRKKPKPGDILRYINNVASPPRLKEGEILCHNHVAHLSRTASGVNGFRYFVCDGGPGHGWKICPCGWRSDFGKHYAAPDHVTFHRKRIKEGKPLTMYWPQGLPTPAGCKRVSGERIAETA